ncbi:MAG TPA: rRNA maturation RNase YbeY [Beijerinckiaceae bacterium]
MSITIDTLIEDERWTDAIDAESVARRVIDAAEGLIEEDLGADAEVSLLFCDDARIRELNAAWRAKDAPTNVLSFPAPEMAGAGAVLGDVALSFDTIRREAEVEGKTFEHHVMHLIAHGFLHLVGFDHESDDEAEEMEAMETRILLSLDAPDPWRDAGPTLRAP